MGFIGRAWRGEEKLWKVFWVYGVLGIIAAKFLLGIIIALGFGAYNISSALSAKGSVPADSTHSQLILNYCMMVLPLLYEAWVFVAIWKCAFNTNLKLWAYLARLLVLLGFISICYEVYAMTFLGNLKGIAEAEKKCEVLKGKDIDYFTCQCTSMAEVLGKNDDLATKQMMIQECVQASLDDSKDNALKKP